MKISTEFTPDCHAIVTVEVDQEQMDRALRRAAEDVSRLYPVPGFRPGKAPFELVVRRFGQEILTEQAVDSLSRSLYSQVIREADLKPVDTGSLEIVQKEPPIFRYTIPIKPQVKLGDYKSLRMRPAEVTVTDAEVQQILERFQLSQATVVPVTRPIQRGDTVTLDVIRDEPNAAPFEAKNLRIQVGAGQGLRLPFEEQLIGMSAGETREIDYTYPDTYEEPSLRGQTVRYRVTIHDVKETQLPALNDQFAQAISEFKTLDQFKGNIREILRREKEAEQQVRFANEVLQRITDQAEIAYPPVLLERQLELDLEDLKADVKRLGLTWDKYLQLSGKSVEQIKQELRPNSEKRLKQLLVLNELAEAEDITVTREEVNAEIERRMQADVAAGGNANLARRTYNTKDARSKIEFNLRLSKAMARVIAMVKGEPTSGKIVTPDMLRGTSSPIPTGLITDPRQVREEDWPRGLETITPK